MKPCSSNYARASKLQKAAANCASGWPLSIPSPMLVTGKDDAHATWDCAKISSICGGALSSTICMFWLAPRRFLLSFKPSLDYLTDALARNDIVLPTQKISRQHLRVAWDGKQVTVTDLGSRNGTLLDGERLLPQVSQPWMEWQWIRISSFWLRLEGASPADISSIQAGS